MKGPFNVRPLLAAVPPDCPNASRGEDLAGDVYGRIQVAWEEVGEVVDVENDRCPFRSIGGGCRTSRQECGGNRQGRLHLSQRLRH